MSAGRFTASGRTRSCPHCKATILESATVCPGCHHHLRFDAVAGRVQTDTPLRVDGILRHPPGGGAWEYSIVLSVRNSRGEEITRQVVGVGALQPSEERTFSLAVEVFKPAEQSADPRPPIPAQAAPLAPASASPATAAPPTATIRPGSALPGTASPGSALPGRESLSGREPPRPPLASPHDPRLGGAAGIPAPRGGTLADPRLGGRDPKLQLKRR